MKSELILVGKTVNKHFIAGIKDYAERITHYMPFNITTIPELKNTKSLSEQQQKEKEGVYIKLAIVQTDRHLVIDVKNSSTQSDVGGSKDMTHGYGIQNVKNTMDKYNGIMEIKNTYGEYETLVLIPINQD